MNVRKYFYVEERQEIINAIRTAELNTSGEVRVHVEKNCKGDVLDRAAYIFKKLEIHKTELRNGVLFYLATEDRKFAILGDAGINHKVEDNFWEEIKSVLSGYFKDSKYAAGLSLGIEMAGEKLKEYFPYQTGDINELQDEISFGE